MASISCRGQGLCKSRRYSISSLIPSKKVVCWSSDEVKPGVRYLEATFRAKKQKICSDYPDFPAWSATQSKNGSSQPLQAVYGPQVPRLLHGCLGFRHRSSVLLCCCSAHLGPQITHGRPQFFPSVLHHHFISCSGTDSLHFDVFGCWTEFRISFGVIVPSHLRIELTLVKFSRASIRYAVLASIMILRGRCLYKWDRRNAFF